MQGRLSCTITTIARIKKDADSVFDVAMGAYDGAEVCELIGLFMHQNISWSRKHRPTLR